MTNQTWTYVAVGAAAVLSLVAWVALVLVPAWTSYSRIWDRLAATWLAVLFAKDGYDRPRPTDPHVGTEGMAYPSGHSAYAVAWVACAVVLVRAGSGLATRLAAVTIAVVLAVVVAATRVYLRAHYLSDVSGGLALGVAIFSLLGIVATVVGFLRQNQRPES